MFSLRRYLTLDELTERRPDISEPDINVLIQAEKDIDNAIANYYEGGWRKSVVSTIVLEDVSIHNNSAVAPSLSDFGVYSWCVLEILSGNNAGLKFPILNSSQSLLTLNNCDITTTAVCKVYQLGKFPRVNDTFSASSVTYKTIPEFIKEAVAYQYEYRVNNAGDLNNKYAQAGYSVSGDSYSESFNPKINASIRERISPQAWDLISHLTAQSL